MSPDLAAGDELAGYRIESPLARGGMGVVYLAEDIHLGRKAVIKVLAPELSESEAFRKRFVRESQLAASLDHPNIIPIYGAGEANGMLYIAMRYVPGTDLRTLLSTQGRLEAERALSIVAQVGRALDAAAARGLVHRDVKPGNILIASGEGAEASDHVYLSDFGLTKRAGSESGLTGTGQFLGTIDYVAPEQIEGAELDGRTDQYSLGCVLYECLTGRVPFFKDADVAVIYAHLSSPPPALTEARPDLPAALDQVIATALAKAPSARYPTCGAMVAAARAALAHGGPAGPVAETLPAPAQAGGSQTASPFPPPPPPASSGAHTGPLPATPASTGFLAAGPVPGGSLGSQPTDRIPAVEPFTPVPVSGLRTKPPGAGRTAESGSFDHEPPRRRRRGALVAVALVVLLVAASAIFLVLRGGKAKPVAGRTPTPTITASRKQSPSPRTSQSPTAPASAAVTGTVITPTGAILQPPPLQPFGVVSAPPDTDCSVFIDSGATGECGLERMAGGTIAWSVEHQPVSGSCCEAFTVRVWTFSQGNGTWLEQLGAEDPGATQWSGVTLKPVDLTGDGSPELVVGFRFQGSGSILGTDVVTYFAGDLAPDVAAHPDESSHGAMVVGTQLLDEYTAEFPNGEPDCCPPFFRHRIIRWDGSVFRAKTVANVDPGAVPPSDVG